MAIYHFSASIVSGGKGASAVAAAAYQSADRLRSGLDGLTKDYCRKERVLYTDILLPLDAPQKYADRETLWNEVEAKEGKSGRYARRVIVALPKELTFEQNKELLRRFTQKAFVDRGMVADIALHDDGAGNPHAHILLTMRPFAVNGEWGQKSKSIVERDKNGKAVCIGRDKKGRKRYAHKTVNLIDWNSKDRLKGWRKEWADAANRALALAGISARIDHRSYRDRAAEDGTPELMPTKHLGPNLAVAEARGAHTTIGDYNRQVRAYNAGLKDDRDRIADAEDMAAELSRAQQELADIHAARVKVQAAEQLISTLTKERETVKRQRQDLHARLFDEDSDLYVYARPSGILARVSGARDKWDRERQNVLHRIDELDRHENSLSAKIDRAGRELTDRKRDLEWLNPTVRSKTQTATRVKTQQRTITTPHTTGRKTGKGRTKTAR